MPQLSNETLDMLILLAPWTVMALACVSVLLLMLRCHRAALACAVVLLLLNGLTEQIPLRMKRDVPKVKPAGTLRVMEYNICGKVEYAEVHKNDSFLTFIKDMDADILFLPENTIGVCPVLEEMLHELYPYSLHDFEEFEQKAKNYADFSIYSRYPLSHYKNYVVDKEAVLNGRPYLDAAQARVLNGDFLAYEVTADIGGKPVTLLHLHLRSNTYEWAQSESSGHRDELINVYRRLQMGYSFRREESSVVCDSLHDCPNPLLICGDFNDLSGSYCVRKIQDCRHDNVHPGHRDRLQDAWWNGGQGLGTTYADHHLHLRIDHIFYSREFDLQSVSVPHVTFSDHYPLVADFILQQDTPQ